MDWLVHGAARSRTRAMFTFDNKQEDEGEGP